MAEDVFEQGEEGGHIVEVCQIDALAVALVFEEAFLEIVVLDDEHAVVGIDAGNLAAQVLLSAHAHTIAPDLNPAAVAVERHDAIHLEDLVHEPRNDNVVPSLLYHVEPARLGFARTRTHRRVVFLVAEGNFLGERMDPVGTRKKEKEFGLGALIGVVLVVLGATAAANHHILKIECLHLGLVGTVTLELIVRKAVGAHKHIGARKTARSIVV